MFRVRTSWHVFGALCLGINIVLSLFIFQLLNRDCSEEISHQQRRFPSLLTEADQFNRLLSILIIDFESEINHLHSIILSVCKQIEGITFVVVSKQTIYPPLNLTGIKNACTVKSVVSSPNPRESPTSRNPFTYLTTKYILVVPDFVRIDSDYPLRDLKLKYVKENEILAIPVLSAANNYYSCQSIDFNVRQWTLRLSNKRNQRFCDAVLGARFSFLLQRSTLAKLNSPFEKPFDWSLFVQAKFTGAKMKIDEDMKFFAAYPSYFGDDEKAKLNLVYQFNLQHLFKNFGIKALISSDGTYENYGCRRDTARCFPTIVNDTPNYLFLGKWTPPCCLENLRATTRYVIQTLKKAGIRYWLDGGSLLGAVRSGDIIPWDYDVDLGIYEEDMSKCQLLREAENMNSIVDENGYVWERAIEGHFYRVQYSTVNRLHVDIFPFFSRNGTMTKHTWFKNHPQDREFPEHYLTPLESIAFVGTSASAPNNYIQFLELKFGKGVVYNYKYPRPDVLNYSDVII